jgi:prepilin peptidase CpaA
MALALVSDFRTYRIKNIIIGLFLAAGLLTNLLYTGFSGIIGYILAALLPAVLLLVFFALRMLGAGDIKLFCAIGAIMGVRFVLFSMAYSFLAGGIMAIIIMLFNKNFKQRALYLLSYLKTCFLTLSLKPYTDFLDKTDGSKFRFSLAIACGSMIELLCMLTII